jgi:hypothetical protein
LFAAENDALRKTLAVKEHHDDTMTTMIPHPDKGVAGSGFNLQEAMGLADDPETYALLRVSPCSARTYLAHDFSALSGTWQLKLGLTAQYSGTANPKTLSAKLLDWSVFVFFLYSFLRIFYFRHVSVIPISRDSHMAGLLKNFSNRISRTNVRMRANEDTWEIRQIEGSRVVKEEN